MSEPRMEFSSELPGVPNSFQHLWTPHRMVYIQHGQQPPEHECPFCLATSKPDEESLIVHRGVHAYALLNLFPYNSGHMLVCPYRHIATYDQATPEEVAEILAGGKSKPGHIPVGRTTIKVGEHSMRVHTEDLNEWANAIYNWKDIAQLLQMPLEACTTEVE